MRVNTNEQAVKIETFSYHLEVGAEGFRLSHPRNGEALIDCPTSIAYRPSFAGETVEWTYASHAVDNTGSGAVTITVTGTSNDPRVSSVEVIIHCFPDVFEIGSRCTVNEDMTLGQWDFFAAGSKLGLFDVHHFRNRHGLVSGYETMNLAVGPAAPREPGDYPKSVSPEVIPQWDNPVALTTYSYDWQFAPHPAYIIFQRDELMLGFGARDMPKAFGLVFQAGQYKLHHMYLDCGMDRGMPVKAGETIEAARFYLTFDYHRDIWHSVDHYVNLLLDDEMIPRRDVRNMPHWWSKPIYCTWPDQGYLAKHTYSHLHKTDGWTGDKKSNVKGLKKSKDKSKFEKSVNQSGVRYKAVNAGMVDDVLASIQRENLNVGSIILDSAWYIRMGQWEADPETFPNMRETVEKIHAAGIKCILWMSVFMTDTDSDIAQNPKYLVNEGELLETYPLPVIDFSHPDVQNDYVKPMMRQMFSNEEGCYNADGLKLDYFAAKLVSGHRVHDREWWGEERFICNTVKLLNDEMKSHKPDAMMMGVSIHPNMVDCQDVIRTYDVEGNVRQHLGRGRMMQHFCSGNIANFDLTNKPSEWEKYFNLAEELGATVQWGHVLGIADHAITPEEFAFIRKQLAKWG